jgi:hypothetical protein
MGSGTIPSLRPRQRLARLREIIAETPAMLIDMNKWQSVCGTVACIAGHGGMDPVLQAEGLKLSPQRLLTLHGWTATDTALAVFFGISEAAARTLFYIENDRTSELTKARQLALMDRLLEEPVED